MPDPTRLEVDPSRCWIRHVRRVSSGGVSVLRARYAAAPLEGVNGRQGWQTATVERRLSDDGSFAVRFPNAAGEDGILHRRRFALLTDPAYRPGEEWLELYRSPGELLFVGTPTRYSLSRTELELSGPDALVLLANARSSEIDLHRAAAPRDAFELYTRGTVLAAGRDLAGWSASGTGTTADGWTYAGASVEAGGGLRLTEATVTGYLANLGATLSPALDADAWTLDITGRVLSSAGGYLRLRAGGATGPRVTLQPHTGSTWLGGVLPTVATDYPGAKLPAPTVPSELALRLVARGEWLYAFVNGELRSAGRRPQPLTGPGSLTFEVFGAVVVVDEVKATSSEPLLCRAGNRGDLHLPGAPTPGGLRGDYFTEPDARARVAGDAGGFYSAAGSPLLEPYMSRLDPTLAFAGGNPPTWQPPGPPGGYWWSARWSGAIYLDLATSDREIRFDAGAVGPHAGCIRGWVAGAKIADWNGVAGGSARSGSLRAVLGARAGWFPIRVEYAIAAGAGGLFLLDGTAVGGSITDTVPASRLSPLGAFSEDVRLTSHRELVGSLTEAFGFQWTCEPRTLESGEFPGKVAPRVRAGRDTAVVIDSLGASEIGAEGDAADAVDGLLVDAAGLADRQGAAQITAERTAIELARTHLVYATGYESLSEVSELALLLQRADSLLALRSSPAETVAARPPGRRELADSFPLTGVLALMRWEPGDGVRLELTELDVLDRTTRQITSVARGLRPEGVAPPTVGFRQRPRGLRAVLERTLRGALNARRNYQGGLTTVQGALAGVGGGAGLDAYSRVPIPVSRDALVRAELAVLYKADASAWTIQVQGAATPLTTTGVGRVDVTAYLPAPVSNEARLYATLTGGTGAVEFILELLVRV